MPSHQTHDPNSLAIELYPLVQRVARKVARQYPALMDLDDLVSVGTIALIEALERVDPERSETMVAYLVLRVRGAMLDELRRHDLVPRSVRHRALRLKQAEQTLTRDLGRAPAEAEIAQHFGITVDDLDRMRRLALVGRLVSTEAPVGEGCLGDILPDTGPSPEQTVSQKWESQAVLEQVQALPKRERYVIESYYLESRTVKEIGADLGVTESRVSQIHTVAKGRLRKRLLALAG